MQIICRVYPDTYPMPKKEKSLPFPNLSSNKIFMTKEHGIQEAYLKLYKILTKS